MEPHNNLLREMLSYFNLSELPFTKELDLHKLIRLPSVEQAFLQLQYLVSLKGVGILTGKSGTGKSCLLRILADTLSTSSYRLVYLNHSSVSTTEFYSHLACGFGLQPFGRRSSLFRKVREQIESLYSSKRQTSILVIDEAHHLSMDILQELRMLSNFAFDSKCFLIVLFCAQEDFLLKMRLASLESLANSISVIVKLEGLSQDETCSYIEKRISDSGCSTPLFTKSALNAVHLASGGCMRVINTIALSSLNKVFLQKGKQVEAEHVQMAIAR